MKTKLTTKTEYYYENECQEYIGDWNEDCLDPPCCRGYINFNTGICEKCGYQHTAKKIQYNVGIEWILVKTKYGTATFHWNVENDREYEKKLISAIRRAGGSCNSYRMDGCKNPDGNDGTYGKSVNNGLSCNGRFSVERI